MRLLEFEAKQLLSKVGIPTPTGFLSSSWASSGFNGTFMLKGQIPAGGRGKAGGILEAATEQEAREKVQELLKRRLRGYRVADVLLEEKVDATREFYLAAAYDTSEKRPVVVISAEGGVEVERLERSNPGALQRVLFSVSRRLPDYRIRECVSRLGISGELLLGLSSIIRKLTRLFVDFDATLAEINPLVLSKDGRLVAVDCHIELDDDALFRHRDLEVLKGDRVEYVGTREMTAFEEKGAEIDRLDHRGVAGRIIDFDGDLGLIIGGGGASLAVIDSVRMHGGNPANYCEVGGNPSVNKVTMLSKLILSKPGVRKIAVISNVVSNTRVDLFARGVIKGILESDRDPAEVIAVFRVPGAWEDEGYKILSRYGITYFGREVSIDQAAMMAVQRA